MVVDTVEASAADTVGDSATVAAMAGVDSSIPTWIPTVQDTTPTGEGFKKRGVQPLIIHFRGNEMRRSTMEQYLKAIHSLEGKDGMVHTKDLAESLGVRPSSVSEFCRKLRGEGYISWEPYHGATLTDEGRRIAANVEEKYDILLTFLLSLGVERQEAIDQACCIEHEISEESVTRLKDLMGKD
jgi:DtxR family Mn-dependent transcriptional regulator